MFTSSGQVVGSMPTGTSLKVLSPKIGGFTLLNTNLKLCVTVGDTQDAFHFTICIFEKRWRTVLTMLFEREPPPSRITLKKPPMSGLAMFCMNSSEFCRNSSTTPGGYQTLITGTGAFGNAVLSSGKRPPLRYCCSCSAPGPVVEGSAPPKPSESTIIA